MLVKYASQGAKLIGEREFNVSIVMLWQASLKVK